MLRNYSFVRDHKLQVHFFQGAHKFFVPWSVQAEHKNPVSPVNCKVRHVPVLH
jgi:hypothetical protein